MSPTPRKVNATLLPAPKGETTFSPGVWVTMSTGAGEPQFLHLLTAERGNRYAHILNVLFTLLRGDHDFFEYRCLCQACEQETDAANQALC